VHSERRRREYKEYKGRKRAQFLLLQRYLNMASDEVTTQLALRLWTLCAAFLLLVFVLLLVEGIIYGDEIPREQRYKESRCRVFAAGYERLGCVQRYPDKTSLVGIWTVQHSAPSFVNTTIVWR
jgi:hypothetical protein